jgi:D-threo-aldose 1-dehydrogenase
VKTRALRSLQVTELGLGGGPLGNHTRAISDEAALATIDAAWIGGVRYFDTAPHYGLGLSERRMGRALRTRPREEFALSTKVGRLLEPNPHPTGSDLRAADFDVPDDLVRRFDYSRDGVRRSIDASLERLGLDHVDIVYVHDADDHVDEAIAQAIPALIELREQGVITAVGVGMNQWQAPLRMIRETDLDVVMLAGRWTLLDRSGQPLLEECAERGVQIVAAAPFNSGLLARDRPSADSTYNYVRAPQAVLARAAALAEVADRFGVPLPAAALQFPLQSPVVAAVVAGLQTVEEVAAALANASAPIPDEAWPQLHPTPRRCCAQHCRTRSPARPCVPWCRPARASRCRCATAPAHNRARR